jgi:hypothetical protein
MKPKKDEEKICTKYRVYVEYVETAEDEVWAENAEEAEELIKFDDE